jgi:hypothetical protein
VEKKDHRHAPCDCSNAMTQAAVLPEFKEWLQDLQLAERVAQAYNEGIEEKTEVSYPFVHSEYPGKVYLETSLFHSDDGRVWLDRPRHRGCYSHLNVEQIMKKSPFCIHDKEVNQPYLKNFPTYQPSI